MFFFSFLVRLLFHLYFSFFSGFCSTSLVSFGFCFFCSFLLSFNFCFFCSFSSFFHSPAALLFFGVYFLQSSFSFSFCFCSYSLFLIPLFLVDLFCTFLQLLYSPFGFWFSYFTYLFSFGYYFVSSIMSAQKSWRRCCSVSFERI